MYRPINKIIIMAQTEEKTYLVNVKSNFDKYAADAAKAKEEVDRLAIANFKMQSSDKEIGRAHV